MLLEISMLLDFNPPKQKKIPQLDGQLESDDSRPESPESSEETVELVDSASTEAPSRKENTQVPLRIKEEPVFDFSRPLRIIKKELEESVDDFRMYLPRPLR